MLDGKLDGEVVGYQLTFSIDDPKEMDKRGIRYVKVKEADDSRSGESRSVEAFEKKYKIKAVWCEIKVRDDIACWKAYVINPMLGKSAKYFKSL